LAVGVGHIPDDVIRRETDKLWPEVVAPNRGPIVCGANPPIRTRIRNGNRHGERIERLRRVLAQVMPLL